MTDIYQTTRNKEQTIAELKTATKALIENNIDMIICEVRFQNSFHISNKKQIEISHNILFSIFEMSKK